MSEKVEVALDSITAVMIIRVCKTARSTSELYSNLKELWGGKMPDSKILEISDNLKSMEKAGAIEYKDEKWRTTELGFETAKKYFPYI
jgi:hypothetical protein